MYLILNDINVKTLEIVFKNFVASYVTIIFDNKSLRLLKIFNYR